MLRDARTMTGPVPLASPDEVEAFWIEWAARVGFRRGRTRFAETRESTRRVGARVDHGRWIADCPTGGCNGAAAAWVEMPRACCLDCGTIFPVEFPDAAEIESAEVVLAARPEEARNWLPAEETVADLRRDNIVRGFTIRSDEDEEAVAIARRVGVPIDTVKKVLAAAAPEE